MNDHALDALLAEYVAPPVPAGLAGRAAAAALALPQEPRLAYARRAGAARRHDRRGKWLRRPMLLGGLVLSLAVGGAVAATLAGVRLDRLPIVEAVLAKLPIAGRETPTQTAPPPREARPAQAPPPVEPVLAEKSRVESSGRPEPPAPRAAAARDDASPVAAPAGAPERSEAAGPRLIDTRPPAPVQPPPPPPPLPAVREERAASTPAVEPSAPPPGATDETRLRQERIERAERLRAARQAQIERLQRIQQRRERIRRLRRD